MKNLTIEKCDTGSNRSETRKVCIKNRLKIIATSALLLAATNAMAGIISLPGSNTYTPPGLALMRVSNCPGDFSVVAGCVRIHTTGLTGELTIRGSDFPPEYDIATTEKVVLPFDQELELVVDIAEGTVSGRSTINFTDASSAYYLTATAEVRGSASCLPLNGHECGQLVVDLELQGILTDPNDPSIVGQLRMDVLSSLIFDGSDVGLWAAMSANTKFGGNEGLINSVSELVLAASA
jgi:hypothetical protein